MHHFLKAVRMLLASVLTIALAIPRSAVVLSSNGFITRREPPSLSSTFDDFGIFGDVEPKRFHIKAEMFFTGDEDKDGLYLDTYYLGAGQYAIVFRKEPHLEVFLTGTDLRFPSLSNGYAVDTNMHHTYDGWVPVLINSFKNDPPTNFAVNNTNILILPDEILIVCDWALGVPQLFRINHEWNPLFIDRKSDRTPSTCASVTLVLESI